MKSAIRPGVLGAATFIRHGAPPGLSAFTFGSPDAPLSNGDPLDGRVLSFGMYRVELTRH